MTVTPEEATSITPDEQALSMLRDIARMKENMKETDGAETDRLLRAARAGALTFDQGCTNQVTSNASTVTVKVIR